MVIVSAICHSCGISESAFNRRDAFEKHVKLHDKKHPLFVSHVLNRIIEKVVSDTGLVCKLCNRSFSSMYTLKRHMKNIVWYGITEKKANVMSEK